MNYASKKIGCHWRIALAALLFGALAGWLLRGCYLDGWSGINL